MARFKSRRNDAMRKIELLTGVNKWAEGSCLACFGDTKVLCTATIENKVPKFLYKSGTGWLTADYSLLPRATTERTEREIKQGRPAGRSQEISRLIGRSLRTVFDAERFGERQVIIDCDVIQADGGTRTAAITGAYVALHLALAKIKFTEKWNTLPLKSMLGAVSVGVVGGEPMLDLDFEEDSRAEVDANFVIDDQKRLIEVQASSEKTPMTQEEFIELLGLARMGVAEIMAASKKALNIVE
jgi:ribonuclease PH